MADEPKTEEAPEEGGKKKGGKKKKIIMILVPLLVLGGGFTMLGGGGKKAKETGETTTTKPAEFAVVKLDPVTVSVGDGNFVRVQIGLSLVKPTLLEKDAHYPAYMAGAHGEFDVDAFKAGDGIKAENVISEVLENTTIEEIKGGEGRKHVKEEIEHKIIEEFHGFVDHVYFGEFTWQ